MRRLTVIITLLSGMSYAQTISTPGVQVVSTDPAGSCGAGATLQYNSTNGKLWGCNSGTWAAITGSGGAPSGPAGGSLTGTYPNPGVTTASRLVGYEVGAESASAAFLTADLTNHSVEINDSHAKTLVEASCITDAGSQTITLKISSTTLFSITCVPFGSYSRSTVDGTTGYINAANMTSTAAAAGAQIDMSGTANGTSKDLKLYVYGSGGN